MTIKNEKLIVSLKIVSVILFVIIFSLAFVMLMGCQNAAGDLYPPGRLLHPDRPGFF